MIRLKVKLAAALMARVEAIFPNHDINTRRLLRVPPRTCAHAQRSDADSARSGPHAAFGPWSAQQGSRSSGSGTGSRRFSRPARIGATLNTGASRMASRLPPYPLQCAQLEGIGAQRCDDLMRRVPPPLAAAAVPNSVSPGAALPVSTSAFSHDHLFGARGPGGGRPGGGAGGRSSRTKWPSRPAR